MTKGKNTTQPCRTCAMCYACPVQPDAIMPCWGAQMSKAERTEARKKRKDQNLALPKQIRFLERMG